MALDLDANSWVRSLQPDQEAGTLLMYEVGDHYPAGQYICLYEGEGEILFEWDAAIVILDPIKRTTE